MSTAPEAPKSHSDVSVKKEPSPFPDVSPSISYAKLLSDEEDERLQKFSPGLRALCVNSPTDELSDDDLPELDILLATKEQDVEMVDELESSAALEDHTTGGDSTRIEPSFVSRGAPISQSAASQEAKEAEPVVIDIESSPSPPLRSKRLASTAAFDSLSPKKLRRIDLHADVATVKRIRENVHPSQPVLPSKPANRTKPSASQPSSPSRPGTTEVPAQTNSLQGPKQHRYLTQRRHSKWWLLDGSVVLRLHHHPTDIIFRLHRSFLIGLLDPTPSYFQQLFNQPTKEPPIESCPVYEIPPTLGLDLQDFEILLEAMHQGILFLRNQPTRSFSTMASILRAAKILQVGSIQDWALAEFRQQWDPEKYFKRLGKANIDSDSDLEDSYPPAKQSIILARFLGRDLAASVLKPAFYQLLRQAEFSPCGSSQDSEDNTINPAKLSAKADRSAHTTPGVDQLDLSSVDIHRLIRARARLAERWLTVLSPPQSTCATNVKPSGAELSTGTDVGQRCCDVLRSRWLELFHSPNESDGASIITRFIWDPIAGLEYVRATSVEWGTSVWCPVCAETFRKDWKTANRKIWKDLDIWLGLTGS